MNNTASQDWLIRFPALAAARDPELQRLVAAAPLLQVPAGVSVFRAGDACERYLMVLEGSVRVQKLAENGREIVLYRVAAGETCVLTTSCLLAGERMAELMTLVEAIAFGRMDSRLAQRLLALGRSAARVTITHQQLAAELGSAREVISRLLKEFERHGVIALERGEIAILDPAALARLANP
jgi:CRP/FNR family transcriptional regulator